MKRGVSGILALCLNLCLLATGCSGGKSDPKAEAPPPLKVERVEDRNVFQVDHPERFALVQATEHIATPQLRVTGTVNPDISRAVPVISLAVGRVAEVDARLGDTVKKGQLLLKVQSADISGAFSDYQKATSAALSRFQAASLPGSPKRSHFAFCGKARTQIPASPRC